MEAPVTSLTKFGAFVQLDEFIEGMIHVGRYQRRKAPQSSAGRAANRAGDRARQVLEIDKSRRRIRLGMKQLVPTAADEYIAEHKEGDTVTGRVSDVTRNRANVELGEGVQASCLLPERTESKQKESQSAPQSSVDLGALTSMLTSKWKGGAGGNTEPTGSSSSREESSKPQSVRSGQVRTFRITKLDAEKKRIEVELAE